MKKLSERQWGDVASRVLNRTCTICGKQGYTWSEPNYDRIGKVDMLTVSCVYCGHVEFFDVVELAAIADKKNEEFIAKGLRTRDN